MGKIAQQTIARLRDSSELRVHAGIVSMDDSKVRYIEDLVTRVEMELAGVDSTRFSHDDIVNPKFDIGADIEKGQSLDDLSALTDRQVEDFDRTVRDVEYGPKDILPFLQTSMISKGPTKHTFFLDDKQGSYKRITGSSKDLPVSHISGQEHSLAVEMGGGSIEWNIQEMDAANFAGIPLEARKARSIRRAYLENIYNLTIFGNDNLEGLMSSNIDEAQVANTIVNPNTVSGADLKYWINKTGREIVEDLTDARIAINVGTDSMWGSTIVDNGLNEVNRTMFTCTLPLSAQNVLLKKYMHDANGGTSQTVWNYLNSADGRLATGVDNYKVILDFDTAFNSGADSGFMLTPNDTEAYSFVKSADLTPLPVQFMGLSMLIPYYDYFGGLKLIRNKALVRRRSIQA